MGNKTKDKCLDCGRTFTVDHGGGFFFHLIRCDRCGKTKAIDFSDLGNRHIEDVIVKCSCGGKYTVDAPTRCPYCHSTRIEEGDIILMYD